MATVVTKTIGTTSRDYATFPLFEAAIPADITSTDEQWIGEAYNDSEFTGRFTVNGHVTDATRDIIIRAATGEGFAEHADAATNPLRYDQTKGVGLKVNSSSNIFTIQDDYVTVTGLQCQNTSSSGRTIDVITGTTGGLVSSNILIGYAYPACINLSGTVDVVNNLIVNVDTSGSTILVGYYSASGINVINNTILLLTDNSSNSSVVINEGSGTDHIFSANAVFGSANATPIDSGFGTVSYNATDSANISGTGSLDSLTYADQFENAASLAALDGRLKAGSDLEAAAIQFTETNDLDIIGQTRDVTTPDIGAWEFTAVGGSVTTKLKIINYTVYNATVVAGGPELVIEGTESANADNATSFVVNVPAGTTDGDMLVLVVSSDGTVGISTPSGWTSRQGVATSGSHYNNVFTRTASSEPASYTLTFVSGSERAWGCITRISGVSGDPEYDQSNSNTGGSDTTGVLSSITPAENNSVVLVFVGCERGDAGNTITSAWPSTVSTLNDNVNGPPGTGNASASGAIGEVVQTTATAVSGNITLALTGSTFWGVMGIVIKPASPPPAAGALRSLALLGVG